MTPDEVRMLDNRYSLLFVRGERPVKDLKYDILKHPNIALTEDGVAAPFLHGIADKADFSIQLTSAFLDHEDNQPAGIRCTAYFPGNPVGIPSIFKAGLN